MIGHGFGVLLFSLVAGYWLLERAETHKGELRRVGRFLGWVVIFASLLGAACRAWSLSACPPGAMGKKGFCPFWAPSATTAVTPAGK